MTASSIFNGLLSVFLRVEESIRNLITTHFPEIFIVELAHNPEPNHLIRLAVDTDEGIRLEQCEAIHRKVNQLLEEEFTDLDCSVEVTSPGVGRPLKLLRQYVKNTGRTLKVITKDGQVLVGVLRKVNETEIELETEVPKTERKSSKVDFVVVPVLLTNIKEARVEIVF